MIGCMELTREEKAIVEILDEAGLLRDMDKEDFHRKKKEDVIIVSCSDGRQFLRGIVNPFMEMYDETHTLAFHPMPRHGGTLILDKDSPLVLPGHTTAEDLIGEFDEAVEWGFTAGCLINHFPCGKARKHNVRPLHIVDSLMNAKRLLKRNNGTKVTIACFMQITDGRETRICHISCDKYLRWREHHTDAVIDSMLQEMELSCSE